MSSSFRFVGPVGGPMRPGNKPRAPAPHRTSLPRLLVCAALCLTARAAYATDCCDSPFITGTPPESRPPCLAGDVPRCANPPQGVCCETAIIPHAECQPDRAVRLFGCVKATGDITPPPGSIPNLSPWWQFTDRLSNGRPLGKTDNLPFVDPPAPVVWKLELTNTGRHDWTGFRVKVRAPLTKQHRSELIKNLQLSVKVADGFTGSPLQPIPFTVGARHREATFGPVGPTASVHPNESIVLVIKVVNLGNEEGPKTNSPTQEYFLELQPSTKKPE